MHVLHLVGVRPNLMKAAPVLRALKRAGPCTQEATPEANPHQRSMSSRTVSFRTLVPRSSSWQSVTTLAEGARQWANPVRLAVPLTDRNESTVVSPERILFI